MAAPQDRGDVRASSLVVELAAAIGNQNLPAHLIDDICADIEAQYGPEALSVASDEAIRLLDLREAQGRVAP